MVLDQFQNGVLLTYFIVRMSHDHKIASRDTHVTLFSLFLSSILEELFLSRASVCSSRREEQHLAVKGLIVRGK